MIEKPAAIMPVLTVDSHCRLRGASSKLLVQLRQQLTIDNPRYHDAKKYGRWVGRRLQEKLTFFMEQDGDFIFPRGYAREAMALCEQCMGQKPRLIDRRRVRAPIDMRFLGELRAYQQEAAESVLGREFGVLVAGTGSGKTVMALAVIAARRQPTLILLHSKELLYQWQERIEQFLGEQAGLVGDGNYRLGPVTVAIVNTARKRLAELAGSFGQLIVDECHRVPATLFTEVVTAFDCRYMLGLSATAYRRDDGLTRLIYLYMGDKVHEVDAGRLAASGAVLEPEIILRPTDFRYGFRGNYPALINALTGSPERNRQIVNDIATEAATATGTLLVVSDRVSHCQKLAAMLDEVGVDSRVLTGRLAAVERGRIIEDLRQGRIRVLVSTLQLVGEGFDSAGLSSLFLTTPIKFSGRLRQVIGRILRPAAGKQARVIDYVDQHVGVLRNTARARQQIYSTGLDSE